MYCRLLGLIVKECVKGGRIIIIGKDHDWTIIVVSSGGPWCDWEKKLRGRQLTRKVEGCY